MQSSPVVLYCYSILPLRPATGLTGPLRVLVRSPFEETRVKVLPNFERFSRMGFFVRSASVAAKNSVAAKTSSQKPV